MENWKKHTKYTENLIEKPCYVFRNIARISSLEKPCKWRTAFITYFQLTLQICKIESAFEKLGSSIV